MELEEMQKEIIANRVRRGFPSATDLSKTTKGLEEEISEWKEALSNNNRELQIDALCDIMVFCLGGLKILGVSATEELTKVIENNKIRTHSHVH